MRQGVVKGIIAVFAATLVVAPGALAATPQDIYADLADNGRLDGTYTQAELQAFVQSASVQGYGNPVVIVTPPLVTPPVVTATPPITEVTATPVAVGQVAPAVTPVVTPAGTPAVTPAGTPAAQAPVTGVAGVNKTVVNAKPKPATGPATGTAGVQTPEQAPLARTASAGTLPFTGAELGLFALVGAALLLGGLLLRASARQR